MGRRAGPPPTNSPEQLAAARRLFDQNWRLAPWVCTKFCRHKWGRRVTQDRYEEFFSLAQEGLWRACLGYRPDLRVKFATYGCKCIWRRMANHMYNLYKGSRPPPYELPVSVEDPRPQDPAERLVRAEAAGLADRVVSGVHGRDRLLIESRAEGATLEELGRRLGISRERVRQLARNVRRRLAHFLDEPAVAAQVEEHGRPARRRDVREYTPEAEFSWGDDSPSQANHVRAWEDSDGP